MLWERLKPTLSEEKRATHPARFVLAEVVNLYEEDLLFEAIHRVVFGVGESFIEEMTAALSGEGHISVLYRDKMYGYPFPKWRRKQ